MIPYAGVSFWAHDAVGDILRSPNLAPITLAKVEPRNERERRHPKLTNGWEFVAGGIAGIMAQTSSYPIEVVRRRMQVGGAVGNHEMKKFGDVVRQIYATAGIRGFYVGLSIGYIKVQTLQPPLLLVVFLCTDFGRLGRWLLVRLLFGSR
jgi:solute carrier family 25 (mitochondrial carrier protein), member 16